MKKVAHCDLEKELFNQVEENTPDYVKKNNLFGLSNMSFESKEACVRYFGKLMENYKSEENMTPIGINPKYCPPNVPKWANDVVWFMNHYAKQIA